MSTSTRSPAVSRMSEHTRPSPSSRATRSSPERVSCAEAASAARTMSGPYVLHAATVGPSCDPSSSSGVTSSAARRSFTEGAIGTTTTSGRCPRMREPASPASLPPPAAALLKRLGGASHDRPSRYRQQMASLTLTTRPDAHWNASPRLDAEGLQWIYSHLTDARQQHFAALGHRRKGDTVHWVPVLAACSWCRQGELAACSWCRQGELVACSWCRQGERRHACRSGELTLCVQNCGNAVNTLERLDNFQDKGSTPRRPDMPADHSAS